MSKAEQETIITFNAADKMANIWTSDPIWMRKLEALGGKNNGLSVELDVPKTAIANQLTAGLSAKQ